MGLLTNSEDDMTKLNAALVGPPQIDRPMVVDEKAGFTPPAWWKGDEFASQSSLAAAMTLRRTQA